MSVAPAATDLPAVRTQGLRKTYRAGLKRHQVAVDSLDLVVPSGGVHGFLGPNGSGKTTTIRMLLGLVHADAGNMEIFGVPVPARLPEVVGRVGSIVEQPKFYPNFSGRTNLSLYAQAIGTPQKRVDQVIEAMGLGNRAKDRFRGYSLGMKQRLAIAGTLLKDPQLLIFDEPTNGLDPAGIREIRETMRSLADQGKTVLVSSHILAEVEQVADTVSVISRGKLLASGSVAELIARRGGTLAVVSVHADDRPGALLELTRAGFQVAERRENIEVTGATDPADITRVLAGAGIYLTGLTRREHGLEDIFIELTSDGPDPITRARHAGAALDSEQVAERSGYSVLSFAASGCAP